MAANKQRQMVWNENKDVLLCRQILGERPYQYKKWCTEVTTTLARITVTLSKLDGFFITTKLIRDHFNYLLKNRGKERNAENKASGIDVPEKEIHRVLDDLIEDMQGCAADLAEENSKKANEEKEKAVAEEMRTCAMESFSETRKRTQSGEDDVSTKAKNRSGSETIRFLMGKQEDVRAQQAEEMKLRNEELALKKKELENNSNMMTQMLQTLAATQQQTQQQLQTQQQQSQQPLQMQQQQMQQQNLFFTAMLEKLNK